MPRPSRRAIGAEDKLSYQGEEWEKEKKGTGARVTNGSESAGTRFPQAPVAKGEGDAT